jgi:UDP-N-acetyl-D-glucosamine dehydrogenase
VNELKLLCSAHGYRHLGSDRTPLPPSPSAFIPSIPAPDSADTAFLSIPSISPGKLKEFDFHTRFIELAGEINNNMPYHVLSSVAGALNRHKKSVNGARVLILGVAYKKDIDDLRESPALTIIELLQKDGAHVSYHDPLLPLHWQRSKI